MQRIAFALCLLLSGCAVQRARIDMAASVDDRVAITIRVETLK